MESISAVLSQKRPIIWPEPLDDTDLEHLDMTKLQTVEEVHLKFQDSIVNWGSLLLATCGALKPVKCFYQLISFTWQPDGTWKYADNKGREDLEIKVPLEDGSLAVIEHLPVTTTTKTLGQMTCPTGGSDGAMAQMQEKAAGWVAKAQVSKLNKRTLVFLLDRQFWPGVSFGISSICATVEELEECLMKMYYNMLPLCGIRRSVSHPLAPPPLLVPSPLPLTAPSRTSCPLWLVVVWKATTAITVPFSYFPTFSPTTTAASNSLHLDLNSSSSVDTVNFNGGASPWRSLSIAPFTTLPLPPSPSSLSPPLH